MPRSEYVPSDQWGDLKVSFELPRSAAKKLRDLAVIGDRRLKEIGILKVKVSELKEIQLSGNVERRGTDRSKADENERRYRYEPFENYENLASSRQHLYKSADKDFDYIPNIGSQIRPQFSRHVWANSYQQNHVQQIKSDNYNIAQNSRTQFFPNNAKSEGQTKIIGISRGVETDGNDPVDMFLFEPVPEWVLENSICISFRRKDKFDVACQTGFGKPAKSKVTGNELMPTKGDRYKMFYGLNDLQNIHVEDYMGKESDKQNKNLQCSSESIRILESLANSLVMADEQNEPDTKEINETATYPSPMEEHSNNDFSKEQDWSVNYNSPLSHSAKNQSQNLSSELQSIPVNSAKQHYAFQNGNQQDYELSNAVSSQSFASSAFDIRGNLLISNNENIPSVAQNIESNTHQMNTMPGQFSSSAAYRNGHLTAASIYQASENLAMAGQHQQSHLANNSHMGLSFTEKLRLLVNKRNSAENNAANGTEGLNMGDEHSHQNVAEFNSESRRSITKDNFNLSDFDNPTNHLARSEAITNVNQPRTNTRNSISPRNCAMSDNAASFLTSVSASMMSSSERTASGGIAHSQQAMYSYNSPPYVTPDNTMQNFYTNKSESSVTFQNPDVFSPAQSFVGQPSAVFKRKRGRPPKSSLTNLEMNTRPLKTAKTAHPEQPKKKRGRPPKVKPVIEVLETRDMNQNTEVEKCSLVEQIEVKNPAIPFLNDEKMTKNVLKNVATAEGESKLTEDTNSASYKYSTDSRSASPVDRLLERNNEKKFRGRTPRRHLKDTVYLDIKESYDRMFSSVGCETMEIVPEDVYYGENYPVIFADDENVVMKFVDMSLAFKLAMKDVAAKRAKTTELVIPSVGNVKINSEDQTNHEEQDQPNKMAMKHPVYDRRKRHQKNRDAGNEYLSKQRKDKLSSSNVDDNNSHSENIDTDAKPSHIMSLRPRKSINLGEEYSSSDSFDEEDYESVYESGESSDYEPLINKVDKLSNRKGAIITSGKSESCSNVMSKVSTSSDDLHLATHHECSLLCLRSNCDNVSIERCGQENKMPKSLEIGMNWKENAVGDGNGTVAPKLSEKVNISGRNAVENTSSIHIEHMALSSDNKNSIKNLGSMSEDLVDQESVDILETKDSKSRISANDSDVYMERLLTKGTHHCSIDTNATITARKPVDDGATVLITPCHSESQLQVNHQNDNEIIKDSNCQPPTCKIDEKVESTDVGEQLTLNDGKLNYSNYNNEEIREKKETNQIVKESEKEPMFSDSSIPQFESADNSLDVKSFKPSKQKESLVSDLPKDVNCLGDGLQQPKSISIAILQPHHKNCINDSEQDEVSIGTDKPPETSLKNDLKDSRENPQKPVEETSAGMGDEIKQIKPKTVTEGAELYEREEINLDEREERNVYEREERTEIKAVCQSITAGESIKESNDTMTELSSMESEKDKDIGKTFSGLPPSHVSQKSTKEQVSGGSRISSLIKRSISAVSRTFSSNKKKTELPVTQDFKGDGDVRQGVNQNKKCTDGQKNISKAFEEGDNDTSDTTKLSLDNMKCKASSISACGTSVLLNQNEPQAGDEAPVRIESNNADRSKYHEAEEPSDLNSVAGSNTNTRNNQMTGEAQDCFVVNKGMLEADIAPNIFEIQSRFIKEDSCYDNVGHSRMLDSDLMLTANIIQSAEIISKRFSTENDEKVELNDYAGTQIKRADKAPEFPDLPFQTSTANKADFSFNEDEQEANARQESCVPSTVSQPSYRVTEKIKNDNSQSDIMLDKTRNITEIDAAQSLLGLFKSECNSQNDAEAVVLPSSSDSSSNRNLKNQEDPVVGVVAESEEGGQVEVGDPEKEDVFKTDVENDSKDDFDHNREELAKETHDAVIKERDFHSQGKTVKLSHFMDKSKNGGNKILTGQYRNMSGVFEADDQTHDVKGNSLDSDTAEEGGSQSDNIFEQLVLPVGTKRKMLDSQTGDIGSNDRLTDARENSKRNIAVEERDGGFCSKEYDVEKMKEDANVDQTKDGNGKRIGESQDVNLKEEERKYAREKVNVRSKITEDVDGNVEVEKGEMEGEIEYVRLKDKEMKDKEMKKDKDVDGNVELEKGEMEGEIETFRLKDEEIKINKPEYGDEIFKLNKKETNDEDKDLKLKVEETKTKEEGNEAGTMDFSDEKIVMKNRGNVNNVLEKKMENDDEEEADRANIMHDVNEENLVSDVNVMNDENGSEDHNEQRKNRVGMTGKDRNRTVVHEEKHRKARNCNSEGNLRNDNKEDSMFETSSRSRRFNSECEERIDTSEDFLDEETASTSSSKSERSLNQHGSANEKEGRRKTDSKKRKSADFETAEEKPLVITRSMRKQTGSPAKRLRSWRS